MVWSEFALAAQTSIPRPPGSWLLLDNVLASVLDWFIGVGVWPRAKYMRMSERLGNLCAVVLAAGGWMIAAAMVAITVCGGMAHAQSQSLDVTQSPDEPDGDAVPEFSSPAPPDNSSGAILPQAPPSAVETPAPDNLSPDDTENGDSPSNSPDNSFGNAKPPSPPANSPQ